MVSSGGEPLSSRAAFAYHLSDGDQPVRLFGERRLRRYDADGATRSDSTDGSWRTSDREENTSLMLSYNALLGERHPLNIYYLQLRHNASEKLSGIYPLNRPGTQRSPDLRWVDSDEDSERRTHRAGGGLIINWGHLSLQSNLVAEQFSLDRSLHQQLPDNSRQENDIEDSRYQFGSQLSETVDEHHWSAGISFEQRKRTAGSDGNAILTSNSDRSGLPYKYDVKENRISVNLLDRWQLTENTKFESGFRMESHEVNLESFGNIPDSGVDTSTYWLPSFHLMHRLTPQSRIRFSGSQSIREPGISDQVPYEFRQDNTVWRGNDALEAELISNIDISYEHNFLRQASARTDSNSGIYLRAFQRIINNAIYQQISSETASDQSTVTVLTPVNNTGNSILRGAEADIEFYPGVRDMRFDIGLGYYHSEMQTAGQLADRYQMPNQPDFMLRLGFIHQPTPGLRYGGHWRYQGKSDRFMPGDSGYLVQTSGAVQNLDLFVEYQWSNQWYSLANLHLIPGENAWQKQSDIRQYRDTDPIWQIALMRVF